MGEMEAFGAAVTGGLLARAVEPGAGEARDDGHTHEKTCLNCGCDLVGPYCHCCGQKSHVHRSLRAFAQDFIAGLFNFEGKFWRTLPMLAWHPGDMTRRYIAGERARFISPVALYLFTVFAMFAVLNFTGALSSTPVNIRDGVRIEIAEEKSALAKVEQARARAAAAGRDTAALDRSIAKRKENIADSENYLAGKPVVTTELGDETPSWVKPLIDRAQQNPDLFVQNIQEAASKYSWLLIPISAPFLWLLFPLRRRIKMYDHAVFVTYSLSFMMILVIAAGLLVATGLESIAGFLFFVPPFHMYRQLKEAYQLGRFSALLRTLLLVTFAFVCVTLFAIAAIAIGAM